MSSFSELDLQRKAGSEEEVAVAGAAFIVLKKDASIQKRKGEEVRYPQIRL